jgi:hypothetical protein
LTRDDAWPPCRLQLDNLAPSRVPPPVRFGSWWTTPAVKDRAGNQWSRRHLVLHLANKEGGARVDPEAPDDALRALEKDNSLGWTFSDPIVGEGVPMLNEPIPASVRQVAHELQATLAPIVALANPSRAPACRHAARAGTTANGVTGRLSQPAGACMTSLARSSSPLHEDALCSARHESCVPERGARRRS